MQKSKFFFFARANVVMHLHRGIEFIKLTFTDKLKQNKEANALLDCVQFIGQFCHIQEARDQLNSLKCDIST